MRRLLRLTAIAAASCVASACTDVTSTSGPLTPGARIGLAPSFTPVAARAFTELSAFGIEVATVRIHLRAPDGSTRDTSVAFPAGSDTLRVELGVPARTTGQTFRADLQLLSADGEVLFTGSQDVVAQSSGLPGSGPTAVQINYTGPGSDAKTVSVSPANASVIGVMNIPVSASGANAAGVPLSSVLVRWTTSDATVATVATSGNATGLVTTTGKRGTVTISAITPLGVTGTGQLQVMPLPARLVVISGGGQTGAAGSAAAQPLVVEVQGADNLPVSGAAVTFRAVTAGGSVASASATSDASGRASTTMALGPTAGAYVFEASAPSLAAVTVSVTATPAPAAGVAIVSGNGQGGAVGTLLPAPLTVMVTNRFGAPVAGATVEWSAVLGGGTLGSSTSITGADGRASSSYRVGTTAKPERVRAAVQGVAGAEVFFELIVAPGPPAEIYASSGNGQQGAAGAPLANPLVATVTDQYGNPIQDFGVTWTLAPNSAGRATFSPTLSTTNSLGHASTNVTLGNVAGPLSVIATINGLTTTFTATVTGNAAAAGILSGQVYDAVTGAPLAGATVTVTGGNANATLTTASDGRYTTGTALAGGTYDVAISASGFVSTSIVGQRVNGNTVAEAVPLVPASGSPGSISGTVLDATNTQPVANATVELRAGMNNTTGAVLQASTTASNGQYSFTNVAAGTYTVMATVSGYANGFKTGISVGATNTSNQNVFISPAGSSGTVRIVLTWRSTPRDLDSHLTGPTASSSRFHVWYAGSGDCSAAPFACLDNDVTGGSGPETITITQTLAGVYRYSVQNYSAAGNGSNPSDLTLSNSGGRVDVYIGNVLAQTFAVPAGAGSLWTVFEMSGTTITPVNSISAGPVLLPSRIPLAGGSGSGTIRRTDATVIFNDIASRPKAGPQ